MLTELIVEDLGVIDHAEVTFEQGSSVLTGETGAGKTLVVAAVGLLLGDRAEKVLVRQGSKRAVVQGRFLVPPDHPVVAALRSRELVDEDAGDPVEVILIRTVPAGGSATARVNGRLVPASLLAEIGPLLVEIAGQHEHGRISNPTVQRRILDEFGGPETVALAERVQTSWRAAVEARRRLDVLMTDERARERELDMVRFEISEIEGAELEPGEDERLSLEARRLESAESIERSLGSAIDSLKSDDGVIDNLASAVADLNAVADTHPDLNALRERLDQLQIEAGDVAGELAHHLIAPDPETLEQVRDRLGAIARLKRKYGASVDEVLEYLGKAQARRDELESATEDIERLSRESQEAEVRTRELAGALGQERTKNAKLLQAEVTGLLAELALAGAVFEVRLAPKDLYEGGSESVEFLVAANPGESPRPDCQGRIGRRAVAHCPRASPSDRVHRAAPTMIFDEVDAGVGGAAAQSVGRALGQLGKGSGRQVIIVTHLPQVAAFADGHLRVKKETGGDRAGALIERVEGDERVAELSRMLAGLPDSERAQEHAQELLELAARTGARA